MQDLMISDRRPVFRHLGIETLQEHMIFMRKDSEICISEGFEALTRVLVSFGNKSLVASIQVITSEELLGISEVSLSNAAANLLGVDDGDRLEISHLSSIASMHFVRSKIYGNRLSDSQFKSIIKDITKGMYAGVHLSAFITACAGDALSTDEILGLTRAMVDVGDVMSWKSSIVADKHCVGGLPANRTTPIVVPIVAAAGLIIPKTSSRAITSPAGTADTMRVMTRVGLTLNEIIQVVEAHGGCIVSGENHLSPADDIIIRVERALDIDSEGQMIASVLSKKVAAGSTHLIIDIPVGPTAKVRNDKDAERLTYYFKVVGKELGLKIKVLITDGTQPVGYGIGPSLEAMDVLDVLRNKQGASASLRDKSVLLAGSLLELAEVSEPGKGNEDALDILTSGKAYQKFMDICEAQGGFNEPEFASYKKEICATRGGIVTQIDNRKLAKVAKLAGAPSDRCAGVYFASPIGKKVKKGQVLFTVYSESEGELEYAINYLNEMDEIITISG